MVHTITVHKPDVKCGLLLTGLFVPGIGATLYVACDGKLCVIGFFSAKLTKSVATL